MEIGIIPKFILRRISDNPERREHFNILASAFLVILLFASRPEPLGWLFQVPHVCLVRSLTGLPCPGCGLLRSLRATFGGDLASGWAFHAAGPVLAFLLLAQILFRGWLLARSPGHTSLARAGSLVVNRLGLLALLGGWLLNLLQ
jgi:hypothetical protein